MSSKDVRTNPAAKPKQKAGSETHTKSSLAKPVAQVQATKSNQNHYATWVKQRVSCAQCSELLDEPHTFLCMHTLCSKCLKRLKLEVRGTTPGYVCPKCKEFCNKDSVRINFLLTELLSFYLMMTQRGTITTCRQCHKSDPNHRCLDCKADFCSDCRKLHDGFELMRVSHRWISHADIGKRIIIDRLMFCEHHPKSLLKYNCLECDEIVCETCLTSQHTNHANELIDQAVKRVTPEMTNYQTTLENGIALAETSVREIKARTSEICNSVEKQAEETRRIHRKQTEKLNADLIQLLSQFEDIKSATKRQGQALIADIEQEKLKSQKVVTWVDTTMRIAQGASLLQEFQSGVHSRVKRMAEQNRIAHLPKANAIHDLKAVLIQSYEHQQQDENNKIGHVVTMNPQHAIYTSDQWNYALKDLGQKSPIPSTTTSLGHGKFGKHFLYEKDELWIPVTTVDDQASIKIFSTNGEELHSIQLPPKISHPNALVKTKATPSSLTDSEFAAIACDTGLYTVTTKGHIIQALNEGSFSDLCLYNGQMYALEYKRQQLMVYNFAESGWAQSGSIEVKHAESGVNDTINVNADRINIASWWGDQIQSYSLTGEKLGQYKEKKQQKSQKNMKSSKNIQVQISNPRISGGDAHGTLIYCDSANRRIQILSADHQWGLTVLQGLKVEPVHVIPRGQNALLILGANNSLSQFNFE